MKNRLFVLLALLPVTGAFGDGVTLPAAERIVLENGTVLILNENHDVPLIGLQAIVRGGAAADPADKHGLASLLANLLEKGAGDRSSAEFASRLLFYKHDGNKDGYSRQRTGQHGPPHFDRSIIGRLNQRLSRFTMTIDVF